MQSLTALAQPSHAPRGRWIWPVVGTATLLVIAVPAAVGAARIGETRDHSVFTALPSRTVTVTQPVTGLDVSSYGSPIRVIRAAVSEVTVVETITFDPRSGRPPSVRPRVSRGELTLALPACASGGCAVGFAVTVPDGVAVKASSEGGQISVAGATSADLKSGGGFVTASAIRGPLTVVAEGGAVTAADVDSADLDSGGGPVTVRRVTGALTATADGGSITAIEAGSANVDSGGGPVVVSRVYGPLTVTADGGSISATEAPGAELDSGGGPVTARAIDGELSATTEGGTLRVDRLTGDLTASTGGGPFEGAGLTGASSRVTTEGGSISIGFGHAPRSVSLETGGGPAFVTLPGGPYRVIARSYSGPEVVNVPVSPTAADTVEVSTGGGSLQVSPAG